MNKILFAFILIIVLFSIVLYSYKFTKIENFNKSNTETNSFFYKFPNIYYTKQFIDNLYIPEKSKKTTMDTIDIDSYLNSDIMSDKIICSSISNEADCWNNNNCQWISKIGQNDDKSYCMLAPKFLL